MYDPEISVNIVDLGLVYSCVITPLEEGGEQGSYQDVHDGSRLRYGQRAQGRRREQLSRLPDVKEVHVEVVFDPLWHPGLMSGVDKLLPSTWITVQHKPRRGSTEKESDGPHLAEKTLDSGAGPETFARTVTKPVESRFALA